MGVMIMSKKCSDCIHWRDTITGWCDYYSWPMDAEDTEPCKAFEPIADSEQYVPVMTQELVDLEERLTNSGGFNCL